MATAGGDRGVFAHERVGAVLCFQPFTRTMNDDTLAGVDVPVLLVVSAQDEATPANTDADRPWEILGTRPGRPVWRLDLERAAHQASSDIGLYVELVEQVPWIPEVVRQYLEDTAADAIGPGLRPWRELLAVQVRAAWAFLQIALDLDPVSGHAAADELAAEPGITLRRR
jgi:hypothetical protein